MIPDETYEPGEEPISLAQPRAKTFLGRGTITFMKDGVAIGEPIQCDSLEISPTTRKERQPIDKSASLTLVIDYPWVHMQARLIASLVAKGHKVVVLDRGMVVGTEAIRDSLKSDADAMNKLGQVMQRGAVGIDELNNLLPRRSKGKAQWKHETRRHKRG